MKVSKCAQVNFEKTIQTRLPKLLSCFAFALLFTGSANAFGVGNCGPQSSWLVRLGIPEYACFSVRGRTAPWAQCAARVIIGYKPVYFGAACVEHDSCYSRRGVRKSRCDRQFRSLLRNTCDYTLDGKFRRLSRRACRKLAKKYNYAVSKLGCRAYVGAQRRAGNYNPNCD